MNSEKEETKTAKRYFKITTRMSFAKTVLVPAEEVKNLEEAIERVDAAVEVSEIDLLNQEAEFATEAELYNTCNGMVSLTEDEAKKYYQII